MQLRHILCPIDFSENHALDYASALASRTGAVLHILFVEESPAPYGIGLYGGMPLPLQQDLETLKQIGPTKDDVTFERHLAFGPAADKILSFGTDQNIEVDVIVMGTHGRTGARRWLLGSVAERVLREATCPVLTVRRSRRQSTDRSPNDPTAQTTTSH